MLHLEEGPYGLRGIKSWAEGPFDPPLRLFQYYVNTRPTHILCVEDTRESYAFDAYFDITQKQQAFEWIAALIGAATGLEVVIDQGESK